MKFAALALAAAAGIAAAQPVSFVDLGVLSGDSTHTGSFAVGAVQWFRFDVTSNITAPLYLDFTTNNSTVTGATTFADTELALYDNLGNFLVTDDDEGLGLRSTLTFGAGSVLALGDSFNLGGNGLAEGEDGVLGAGTYWLAIGEYNTIFGLTGWTIDQFGNGPVDYVLDIYTNVPTQGAVAILGFGLLIAARRRR